MRQRALLFAATAEQRLVNTEVADPGMHAVAVVVNQGSARLAATD
jgi:hypothetical protein